MPHQITPYAMEAHAILPLTALGPSLLLPKRDRPFGVNSAVHRRSTTLREAGQVLHDAIRVLDPELAELPLHGAGWSSAVELQTIWFCYQSPQSSSEPWVPANHGSTPHRRW